MSEVNNASHFIKLIEEDHSMFACLIERLHEALGSGRLEEEVEERKAALLAHLRAHMGCEEWLMLEGGYSLAFSHAREHKALHDQVTAVLNGLKSRTVHPKNGKRLLLEIYEHHVKSHDTIFCRNLVDRYSLQEVAEGGGI